jgi:hypothetical protein
MKHLLEQNTKYLKDRLSNHISENKQKHSCIEKKSEQNSPDQENMHMLSWTAQKIKGLDFTPTGKKDSRHLLITRYLVSLLQLKYNLSNNDICSFTIADFCKRQNCDINFRNVTIKINEDELHLFRQYIQVITTEYSKRKYFFINTKGTPISNISQYTDALRLMYRKENCIRGVAGSGMFSVNPENISKQSTENLLQKLIQLYPPNPDARRVPFSIIRTLGGNSSQHSNIHKLWLYRQNVNRAREIVRNDFKRNPHIVVTNPKLVKQVCMKYGWQYTTQLIKCLNKEAQNHCTQNLFKRRNVHVTTRSSECEKTDLHIVKQNWQGLVIYESAGKGKGVKSTKFITKGSIICDYHGVLYSARVGERIHMQSDDNVYSYFFQYGAKKYMINGNQNPCPCHEFETFGRLINHSISCANVKGTPYKFVDRHGNDNITILFRATKNISPDEELLYDYGVRMLDSGCKEKWLSS